MYLGYISISTPESSFIPVPEQNTASSRAILSVYALHSSRIIALFFNFGNLMGSTGRKSLWSLQNQHLYQAHTLKGDSPQPTAVSATDNVRACKFMIRCILYMLQCSTTTTQPPPPAQPSAQGDPINKINKRKKGRKGGGPRGREREREKKSKTSD